MARFSDQYFNMLYKDRYERTRITNYLITVLVKISAFSYENRDADIEFRYVKRILEKKASSLRLDKNVDENYAFNILKGSMPEEGSYLTGFVNVEKEEKENISEYFDYNSKLEKKKDELIETLHNIASLSDDSDKRLDKIKNMLDKLVGPEIEI